MGGNDFVKPGDGLGRNELGFGAKDEARGGEKECGVVHEECEKARVGVCNEQVNYIQPRKRGQGKKWLEESVYSLVCEVWAPAPAEGESVCIK